MHLLDSLGAILAWTFGHQLWLSCFPQPRNLLPGGPTQSCLGGSGPSPCCHWAPGLIKLQALKFWLLPPFWTYLKHRLWDLLLPPRGKPEKQPRSGSQGKSLPIGETHNFPLPPPSQGLLQSRVALDILHEDFPCSWRDTTADILAVSSELFWSNVKVSPGIDSLPSLPPFSFYSPWLLWDCTFQMKHQLFPRESRLSGFVFTYFIILNNVINTCKTTTQNKS